MVFGTGGVAGILAGIIGGAVVGRSAQELSALAALLSRPVEDPARGSVVQRAAMLRRRMEIGTRAVIALQCIASAITCDNASKDSVKGVEKTVSGVGASHAQGGIGGKLLMRAFTYSAVFAALLTFAAPASAQVSVGVTIGRPPAPQAYRVPARPGPDYFWVEGKLVPARQTLQVA